MNDEDLLFAFDPLALAQEALALDQQLVVAGGGFPHFWENIGDLLGAGLDIFGFVGRALDEAREWLWTGIGGAIRWAGNNLENARQWLGEHISGWFEWVLRRLSDLGDWLGEHISGWFEWVLRRLSDLGDWLGEHISDWAEWVLRRLSDLGDWLGEHISGWFEWVLRRLSDLGDWLGEHISGWASWLGEHVSGWGRWLGEHVSGWAETILDRLGDLWEFTRNTVVPTIIAGFQDFGAAIRDAFSLENLTKPFAFLGEQIGKAFLWVSERLIEPVVDLLQAKLGIPLRLLRGEFPSFEAFLGAVMDPPPAAFRNVAAFLNLAVVMLLSVVFMFFPVLRPINEKWAQPFYALYRPTLPTPTFLTAMLRREFINIDVFEEAMWAQGYPNNFVDAFLKLEQLLPSPTDLVRFGVREVYTPEIAERFGQFQDFPEQFAAEMKLVGFDRERARQFWAAHWELPSPMQGFEMLHRGVIDMDDLKLLLRALDVMPFWRDRLIQISYNPITRIDVRRMYQAGVIDLPKVESTYRALGYTPEDAKLLADWVALKFPRGGEGPGANLRDLTEVAIKSAYFRRLVDREEVIDRLTEIDYPAEDAELIVSIWDFDLAQNPALRGGIFTQELSRSVVEKAYERRLFDFNRAANELIEGGFTQDDAEIILALVDQRQAEELTELQIDAVLNDFQADALTLAQVRSRLADTDLHPERIDFLVQRELLRRQVKTRRLTVAQLKRARDQDLIPTDDELLDRLVAMGYNDADAAILVAI